jgi:hypothetical protein
MLGSPEAIGKFRISILLQAKGLFWSISQPEAEKFQFSIVTIRSRRFDAYF